MTEQERDWFCTRGIGKVSHLYYTHIGPHGRHLGLHFSLRAVLSYKLSLLTMSAARPKHQVTTTPPPLV